MLLILCGELMYEKEAKKIGLEMPIIYNTLLREEKQRDYPAIKSPFSCFNSMIKRSVNKLYALLALYLLHLFREHLRILTSSLTFLVQK